MYSIPIKVPFLLDKGKGRNPGIHLSGIVKTIGEAEGLLDEQRESLTDLYSNTPATEVQSNSTIMWTVLGTAWEHIWAANMNATDPCFLAHPFVLCFEDVYANIDGLGGDDTGYILHECKMTYKAPKPASEMRLWMWQTAGYLKMLSEHFGERCTRSVLHPLYARGPGITAYRPEMVIFEWEEIEMSWNELMKYKHKAVPEQGWML